MPGSGPGLDDRLSSKIAELVTNECYESALFLADSVTVRFPENPYGPMLTATVLLFRSIDFEDELDDAAILKSCQEVESRTFNLLQDGNSKADYWVYLGSIDMYRTLVSSRKGLFFSAFKEIIKAGEHFEAAVDLDSTCWDAHYGYGMYIYHRSSRAGLLRSLGLIRDQREKGIEHIKIASEKGHLTALAAQSSLIWIATETKNYVEAERLGSKMSLQFPGKRGFLWGLGKEKKVTGKWEEAIAVYSALLASVRSQERNNHYNEIGCLHSLALANSELKNWGEVLRLSKEALNIVISESVAKRKKGDISRLKAMQKTALKELKNARHKNN